MSPRGHAQDRSILILGGNPETGAIVDVANAMGLHTVVVDPYPGAPAKRRARRAYDLDVKDFAAIDRVVADEHITGILVGVADPLVPYYQQLCERHGMPCYANPRSVAALTSKSGFIAACRQHGIPTTPTFDVDPSDAHSVASLPSPVVVKPTDCGAGVGVSVCHDAREFATGVALALAASPRRQLVIERFMRCDDMFAYYTFVDGHAYLSAAADRHKAADQAGSPVCIAAEYPSKHLDRFLQTVHPALLRMFADLQIRNAVLLIQFFVDADGFYAYDPGFRLQGEAPHLYLKHLHGFDQREMLLDLAMTGTMYRGAFGEVNDPRFKGQHATTVWALLRAGRIGRVSGLQRIAEHPDTLTVLQRLREGDVVTPQMTGTERQVLARIYTLSPNRRASVEQVRFIRDNLSVVDEHGDDMLLAMYNPATQP